jgi:FkbM family methyltransferase
MMRFLQRLRIYSLVAFVRLLEKGGVLPRKKLWGETFRYSYHTDIGRKLYWKGSFEQRELDLIGSYIKKDSVALDIGANIGLHSVFLALKAPSGLIVAFEPARKTFDVLSKNTKGLPNILPLPLAISDTAGVKKFFVASDDAYSGLKDTGAKPIAKTESIVAVTGDGIVAALGLSKVDFIKIDVEGHDHEAVCGLEKTLKTLRPVVWCEILRGKNFNLDPEKAIRKIVNLKYKAFVMDHGSLVPFKTHDDALYQYIFVPEEKI